VIQRVLFLLPSAVMGGMESHTIELARKFSARGLHVATIIPQDCLPLEVSFIGAGAQVRRLEIDARHGRTAQLRAWPRLVGAIRAWRPDVVHVQTGGPSGGISLVAAARAAGVKTIVVSEHEVPDDSLPPRQRVFRRWMDRMSHVVVAVSKRNARLRVERLGAPQRFAVVRNGVPMPAPDLKGYLDNRASVQKRYGINKDAIVIGCLVRLVDGKGLDDLLRAFALLATDTTTTQWRGPRPELLLVGDGPLRQQLEDLARTLDVTERVHFAGHQPEPAAFLDTMDLFVLAVPQGSMSIALLEAMARGICSIITFPGPEEPVIDERTGLTAPPSDPLGLALVIERAVLDAELRARLGAAGANHVRQHFSVQRVADDLLVVYRAAHARLPSGLRFASSEPTAQTKSWRIHQCARDPECRAEGAPNRLYVHTPWGSLIVALDHDSTTQVWLPGVGYTRRWAPIVWHPKASQ
jgi:glycosyltransferase involved in cell wall biosynthesis